MVRTAGLEPAPGFPGADFKSFASRSRAHLRELVFDPMSCRLRIVIDLHAEIEFGRPRVRRPSAAPYQRKPRCRSTRRRGLRGTPSCAGPPRDRRPHIVVEDLVHQCARTGRRPLYRTPYRIFAFWRIVWCGASTSASVINSRSSRRTQGDADEARCREGRHCSKTIFDSCYACAQVPEGASCCSTDGFLTRTC
jgi:hypothetical protein